MRIFFSNRVGLVGLCQSFFLTSTIKYKYPSKGVGNCDASQPKQTRHHEVW